MSPLKSPLSGYKRPEVDMSGFSDLPSPTREHHHQCRLTLALNTVLKLIDAKGIKNCAVTWLKASERDEF